MMKKYEYKTVCNRHFAESDLNRLGSEGWELVSVTIDSLENEKYYFKRRF